MKSKNPKSIWYALFSMTIVAGLVAVAYYALHSPQFVLKQVKVAPLTLDYPLKEHEVLEALDLPVGSRSLIAIPLKSLEGQLKTNPWVKGLVFSRQFPDTLHVRVIERTPIALVASANGKIRYLEEDGTQFEEDTLRYSRELPILNGFSSEQKDLMNQAVHFLKTWFHESNLPGVQVSSLSFDAQLGVRAVVRYPLKSSKNWLRPVLELGPNFDEALTVPQQNVLQVFQYLSDHSMNASRLWLGDGKKIVVKISRSQ